MKPRVVLALAGAAALVVAAGAVIRAVSTDKPSAFTAEYTQTALWDGGLIGTFTVRNVSDRAATGWNIEFELPRDTRLAGVWNGELFASKSRYVIEPTAQSRTVGAHRSLRVGLSAVPGGVGPVMPRNCTINGKTCRITIATAALGAAPTVGLGVAPPVGAGRTASGGPVAGSAVVGAEPVPAHAATPVTPARPTIFAPAVDVTNGGRPPLKAIADLSGASALTLVSALPSAGGSCELRWGGVVDPAAYAREIADALDAHVALIASVGATNGLDLAHACGSATALQAQVRRLLDLGLRSVDISIAGASLADNPADDAADARLAETVVRLKAQYPGLTVSYSVPSYGVPPELVTRPLLAARNAGAVIDRVNVLPVDVAAPPDVLRPLLAAGGAVTLVDSLRATATSVHDQIMRVQAVDTAAAWQRVGITPVVATGDLVDPSPRLVDALGGLARFARSTGLGLVGFLPLNTGQACLGGLVGQVLTLPAIPLLSCVESAALPGFFTITDDVGRALR